MNATLIASVCALAIGGLAARARGDSLAIDFEPPTYTTGNINGQDGWSGTGGIPNGGTYDYEVANTGPYGSPPGFATQSFRISNAVTSGSFGDWAFSKSLMDEAGEPGADNGGFSGGTRQEHFEVSFDIVSTVPGSEQPGLQISVAPDRGDGARMSFLKFRDTPGGIDIDFADYHDNFPFGSPMNLADGCDTNDDFVTTTIATGLDRSVSHHIKLTMDFVTGPRNDVVTVYVDGQPFKCGTSWEDYYRYCTESQPPVDVSRTVDSLLLQARTGGGTAPATLGFGFLVDNLDLLSGPSDCGQDCVCPPVCGNGVVESGEQCDPPASSTCGAFLGGACGPDCQCPTTTTTTTPTTTTTLPTCGNGMIDPGEQCDPPGSSTCGAFVGGACGPNCQCPTTTTTVQTSTSTTTLGATTTTTQASTTTTQQGSTTTTVVSTTTTTTQCVPTGSENTSAACSDMIDNDCNGLIDCADPACNGIFPCPRARKDPTVIQFGRAGSLDLIRGHAKLTMAPVDISALPVHVLLTNSSGAIYSDGLPAGALTGDPNGTIFRFSNPDARTAGGMYALKIKKNRDGTSYTFSFRSYGDLSRATDPNMRLQFYIGDDPNTASDGRLFITLDTPWTKTPHGWRAPKDH